MRGRPGRRALPSRAGRTTSAPNRTRPTRQDDRQLNALDLVRVQAAALVWWCHPALGVGQCGSPPAAGWSDDQPCGEGEAADVVDGQALEAEITVGVWAGLTTTLRLAILPFLKVK